MVNAGRGLQTHRAQNYLVADTLAAIMTVTCHAHPCDQGMLMQKDAEQQAALLCRKWHPHC
jgi:hypothetical protein